MDTKQKPGADFCRSVPGDFYATLKTVKTNKKNIDILFKT